MSAVAAFWALSGDYLAINGWLPIETVQGGPRQRWRKAFARGSGTERLIEADTSDAVTYQARYDGKIAFAERFAATAVMKMEK